MYGTESIACLLVWRGGERLRQGFFDSLGRVANVSLKEYVCAQAGCRRAGDISLPSFIASMNSVGELVETILSRINIADANKLAEAVESWRGASGGGSLPEPDDPKTSEGLGPSY